MKSLIRQHLTVFFLYSLLAFALLSPTGPGHFIPKYSDTHTHLAAITQGNMAFHEGQMPLRTAPKEYHGWGYPKFQFYSPTLYVLTSCLSSVIAPNNPYITFKIVLFVSFLLGGFFLYRASWQLTQHFSASVLSGFAYMAAPYFLIDAHWRCALAEVLGLGVLPLVLYTTLRLFLSKKFSITHWILSSFAWYLLLTIHLITFVNTSLFLGLFILWLSGKKSFVPLLRTASAYAWACLLGAWFLAPVLFVAPLIHISQHFSDTLMTFNWLTALPRLFSITSMGYAHTDPSHLSGPFYPAIGWPLLIGFTLCLFAIFAGRMRPNAPIVIKLILLFLLALFITWSPVNFWQYLPKALTISQYSYRLLAQVIWIGGLLMAFAFSMILEEKMSDWLVIPLGIWLIGLSSASWLNLPHRTATNIQTIVQNPYLGYAREEITYLISTDPKITPIASQIQPNIPVTALEPFCQRIHAKTICHLPESFAGGITQFPVLYYPKLITASLDHNNTSYFATYYNDKIMLVGLSLSPGKHILTFELTGISWANKLSAITMILSGLLLIAALFLRIKASIQQKSPLHPPL